ncbi:hypothetical protein HWV23_04120 [Natronomonas halophila]|uniref:hypothetical protein n=1 Tax=Natronomonas halophila TaxID=2747817 RepID=UPI0015B4F1FC|nr:hypothetical protein [Natronomonas halophila]QLD84938.1 hypothetical protein HWV23_04120 [Natronomonas halophila]
MTGYYDIVLGLIPLSLAGLTAILLAAGMSLSASVPIASVVAFGLMGHAMFVNAPVATPASNGGQTAPDTSASGNGSLE